MEPCPKPHTPQRSSVAQPSSTIELDRHATRSSRSTTSPSATPARPAVADVTLVDPEAPDHGLHRPVGLRQEHAAAQPQPHERPRARRLRHGSRALPRRRPVLAGHRPGRGAPPHRHGLPAPEPVPEVDLRQRRVRPARARHEGQHGGPRRGRPAPRRALGRVEGHPQAQRARPLGRAAAAPLHRARPGRRAGRAAARRAVLGARPDLDRAHRGAHDRAARRLHARRRHAQHAAGRAHRRRDGVLLARADQDAAAARGVLVEFGPTTQLFSNPTDSRTDDYVQGRFG